MSITIVGIHIRDLALFPSQITILNGGIGFPNVTINVVASPGRFINSLFKFFISQNKIDDKPRIVKEYIGAEFDIDTMT